jgi:hypothetical protein
MKLMIMILLVFCSGYVQGQPSYTRLVDSTAKYIDGRDVSYTRDSIRTEFDKDSNIIKTDSVGFIYADSKAKKLLKVYELKSTRNDTTSIEYYFADKKLIKISADFHSKNRTVVQVFYFKENKLVFPRNYFSEIFQVDDYIEQARTYLKQKFKNLNFTQAIIE